MDEGKSNAEELFTSAILIPRRNKLLVSKQFQIVARGFKFMI